MRPIPIPPNQERKRCVGQRRVTSKKQRINTRRQRKSTGPPTRVSMKTHRLAPWWHANGRRVDGHRHAHTLCTHKPLKPQDSEMYPQCSDTRANHINCRRTTGPASTADLERTPLQKSEVTIERKGSAPRTHTQASHEHTSTALQHLEGGVLQRGRCMHRSSSGCSTRAHIDGCSSRQGERPRHREQDKSHDTVVRTLRRAPSRISRMLLVVDRSEDQVNLASRPHTGVVLTVSLATARNMPPRNEDINDACTCSMRDTHSRMRNLRHRRATIMMRPPRQKACTKALIKRIEAASLNNARHKPPGLIVPCRVTPMTPAVGVDPASHKHASSKLPVNTRMETRLNVLCMPMYRRQETLVEEKIEPLKRRSVHRTPQRDIRCANPRGNRHWYRYTINRRGWQRRCMRNVCHGVLEPPTPVGRRTEKP